MQLCLLNIILFFHTIFFLIEMGDEKVAILFDWMPYFYEIYDSLYYPYMDAIAYPIMDLLYSYGLYEFFIISDLIPDGFPKLENDNKATLGSYPKFFTVLAIPHAMSASSNSLGFS